MRSRFSGAQGNQGVSRLALVATALVLCSLPWIAFSNWSGSHGIGIQRQKDNRNFCGASEGCQLQELAQLRNLSRRMPYISDGSPVLASSNWRGRAKKEHWDVGRGTVGHQCGWHVYRYRVVNRVVYADHNPRDKDLLYGNRDAFLEMLMTAIWLYSDFPDVELWVSLADEPSRCSLHVPILQYTILDLAAVEAAKSSDVAYVGGVPFSIPHLMTGEGSRSLPRQPKVEVMRGTAFSHPMLWDKLSMLPLQMHLWQQQLARKAQGQPRRLQAIWRGGNTGFLRGWPPAGPCNASASSQHCSWGQGTPYDHPMAALLLNKRMLAVQIARYHNATMDVGLHEVLADLLPKPMADDRALVGMVRALLVKPFVPLDDWGAYALQLSIDGHGLTGRLPLQYLQNGSAVLKLQSPLLDWYDHLFKPGTHYASFKYDLSDMVQQVDQLLAQEKNGSTQLRDMAKKAAGTAVEAFSFYGQLDALAYAVAQVKQACPWRVVAPPGDRDPKTLKQGDWYVPQLPRSIDGQGWRSPVLSASWAAHVRESMWEVLAINLPPRRQRLTSVRRLMRGMVHHLMPGSR